MAKPQNLSKTIHGNEFLDEVPEQNPMSFLVHPAQQPNQIGLDPTVYRLGRDGDVQVMIWPALGFNCLSWQVQRGPDHLDLLYLDPGQFTNGRPTRSGIPVLFPFPNRIRNGIFTWEGKTYQLPINDGTKKNAIHGFACRHPWRVVDQGGGPTNCWLTGEFQGSKDAPEELHLWPADYRIRLTYRLSSSNLRLEAEVSNPDQKTLPFGLGYHPYFRIPFVAGRPRDEVKLQVSAKKYWELEDTLPTGRQLPLDGQRDLNRPRSFNQVTVDDVFCDLPNSGVSPNDFYPAGEITCSSGHTLRVLCSPGFREQVVFTPPHRDAFCIEPYTCVTDAINLKTQGIDSGLLLLEPGQSWKGAIQLELVDPVLKK